MYTPNNLQIFTAAFAGALAGMGASDRVPTDPDENSYDGLASVAGAFAQSFDTEWGIVVETLLDIECTQELSEVAWQDRAPQAVSPFLTPATYTTLTRALIAMIRAANAYYTAQGIIPPPTPTGTPLATVAPVNVDKSPAVIGVSTEAARADHKHDIDVADPIDVGTFNAAGVASTIARSDHTHNLPFVPVQTALNAATADVGVNNNRITDLSTPLVSTDAATKAYVDAVAAGLDPKAECRVATTANIVLVGLLVIDGVATVNPNRVLVKNQAAPTENGIYVASAGVWTRATDMPAGSSAQGAYCFISEGTVNADTAWICTTNAPADIVGTDPIAFNQFSSFPLATVAPVNVTKAAAAVGVSTEAARADHKHDITTAIVSDVASANAEGVASSLARSDHAHNLPFTPVQTALAAASGAVAFNAQNCTGVNSVAVLGGTASTAGGIRTPFNASAQTIIGGKKTAGTQNDIISTIGAQIHIGNNASAGTAWDYIYLVTNQYMVLYPQIQGQFHVSSGEKACWQTEGWSFGPSNSPTMGSGSGVVNYQNAATVPTVNPTNSFLMYSEGGAAKVRGSGGTITTFGPADPHCPECGSDHVHEYETEIYNEYTLVCVRCLVAQIKEIGEFLTTLVGKPLKDVDKFTIMTRERKAEYGY